MTYQLWVNDARTIYVCIWDNGTAEVATRPTPDHLWGPPSPLSREEGGRFLGREAV
jgi:hypothetical protein